MRARDRQVGAAVDDGFREGDRLAAVEHLATVRVRVTVRVTVRVGVGVRVRVRAELGGAQVDNALRRLGRYGRDIGLGLG